MYWSIGLLPFKDDFWSESDNYANPWNSREADPELQTVVSSLIAGPVGPADGLGNLNKTRIMRTCRQDGTLLKPHGPAMNLDSTFKAALADKRALGTASYIGVPSVWGATMSASAAAASAAATSSVSPPSAPPPVHHVLLFANVSAAGYAVELSELLAIEAEARRAPDFSFQFKLKIDSAAASQTASFVAREFYSGEQRLVDAAHPLKVSHAPPPPACASMPGTSSPRKMYCIPFELWTLAPVPAPRAGWVMLGEVDKYVGVSGQRFEGQTSTAKSLSTNVLGSAKEVVSIAMLDCRAKGACASTAALPKLLLVRCVITPSFPTDKNGRARLQCGASCTCA